MALSLNPKINPLIRLYEFFGVPGVKTEDNPNYLRVSLPVNWAELGAAYELVRFLSGLPAGVLSVLELRFGMKQLADFTGASAVTWFEWDTIDELIKAGKLCDVCAESFQNLHTRLDEYEAGASWPTIEDDSRAILDELESCPTCGPYLTVAAAIDKAAAANEFLIADLLSTEKHISALVWSDPTHMSEAFESFQEFLEFIKERVDEPVVMFFYQPVEQYQGYYFKILSLKPIGIPAPELDSELTRELSSYTTDVLTNYQMLRADHKDEKRTDLGERFNIPPTLFLRQNGDLAAYPSHPVFTSGPLRSLLVYSIMAWLARKTEQDGDATVFTLREDDDNPLEVSVDFTRHDVFQNQQSIFANQDWPAVAGQVARSIGQSVGSEYFRDCWTLALDRMTAAEFTAEKLFATLQMIQQKAEEKGREPNKDIKALTPDLALYIYIDTRNKKLVYQLGYLNAGLGLGFKRFDSVELNLMDNQDLLRELDESAKRNLTSMLDIDPDNPAVKIPNMQNLETRGEALWDDMIPSELKQAYVRLRRNNDLSLFIFSEDRSFPWELIKPRELQGSEIYESGFSDDWWALRFGLARWAPGAPPPANEISITKVCCVAASSVLSSAEEEIKYLESLTRFGVTVDQPKTKNELIDFLSSRKYDVIHFACHGEFKAEDPGESAVQLPDGSLLQPDDLRAGNIPQKIRDNRPLIFLNCCHSGRTGSTLVGIAGWAKRLVDWGCGAFIGCGWEVADPLAAQFAITFYQNFKDKKKSLGQAIHHARQQIKDRSVTEGRPQNSTWLAYYLYGNPNCSYKP